MLFILLWFWIPRLGSCPCPPEWIHLGCSFLWMPPLAHMEWLFLTRTTFPHASGPDTSHQAADLHDQAQLILLGQPSHIVLPHSLGLATHPRTLRSLVCRCWCLPSSVPTNRFKIESFIKDREIRGGRQIKKKKKSGEIFEEKIWSSTIKVIIFSQILA